MMHHVNEGCKYRDILSLSITVGAASIVEENMRNEMLDKKTHIGCPERRQSFDVKLVLFSGSQVLSIFLRWQRAMEE